MEHLLGSFFEHSRLGPTSMPMCATKLHREAGTKFRLEGGVVIEIVRPLTSKEVYELDPKYYSKIAQVVGGGTEIYWYECKRIRSQQGG